MTTPLESAALTAHAYTSDSRECAAGDIFVALKGEKSDGHDYVKSVLARAPAAVVVSRAWAAQAGLTSDRLLAVDDTHAAHRELAALFRRKFTGKVLAVGGSSGKTSTKEFLATLLAEKFRLVKTDKSQNGELGIPKTLEKLRSGVELAVIEVGIDAPGDMARHAQLVQPDLACLTSIGEEHMNLLGTIENVYKEEKILFDVTLARGGRCFAPAGDEWLQRLAPVAGVTLVPSPGSADDAAWALARERLPNAYALQNARLAIAVARELGLGEAQILAGIRKLSLPDGRGNVLRVTEKLALILDHYNSNPSSLRAGLQSAADRARAEKKPLSLILGDMLDLGESTRLLHEGLVNDIKAAKPLTITLVGPEMSRLAEHFRDCVPGVQTFGDAEQAAAFLRGRNFTGVVLLKGSRGMKLERVLDALKPV